MADDEGGLLSDIYGGVRSAADAVGIGEAISIARSGDGLTPGADKVMGPLGIAMSGIDMVTGMGSLGKGIRKTSDGQDGGIDYCDAAHDLLAGGSGLLGNAPGPAGALAKAFGGGFAIGDMLAPHVFGTEAEDNKPRMEQIPEDGKFKPSTGNKWVDKGLDVFGVRD